jgi:vacuolar-type H+-ATPase subunit I/STV1
MMKSIWGHKWVVVIGALVVLLSVGAIAWAATSEHETSWDTALDVTDDAEASFMTVTDTGTQAGTDGQGAGLRQRIKEKRDQWLKRQVALMEHLRDDMSAEDRGKYDELVEEIKEKRATLQEAREDLADTLKELRELTNEYLDVEDKASD